MVQRREPGTKPEDFLPAPLEYYCRRCHRGHKVTSKIGKRHRIRFGWEVIYRTVSGKTKRKVVQASDTQEAWKEAVKGEKEMIDYEISRKRLFGAKRSKKPKETKRKQKLKPIV